MGSLVTEVAKRKALWTYPKVFGHNCSERWGHSACFDHGFLYIFGGCCGGLNLNDVVTLNLQSMCWTSMDTTGHGPGPRDSHSAVLARNKMIVFGGTNGCKKVNDVHILDLPSKEWKKPIYIGTPPSPRESHTATLVGDSKMVIFGGSGEGEGNYLNDLHVLDVSMMRWSSPEVKGDLPIPRDSHSAVAIGNKLVVYGGDCGDRNNGDVDVFDMDTLTWSRLAVQGILPGVRAGHASVNIGTKVYVIGGVGDRQYYSDVWVLETITCCWTRLDVAGHQPQGRFSHAAVVAGSDIILYGGCGEDERPLNDLLVLQLGAVNSNGCYSALMCKSSAGLSNLENNRSSRATENQFELESFVLPSDASFPKRLRTSSSNIGEIESEQEEHSVSLSQHSSPSLSDQEHVPPIFQGFHLVKQLDETPTNPCSFNRISNRTREKYHEALCTRGENLPHKVMLEQKHSAFVPMRSLMGADVRGKVDGAFDSGLLMTATVNGKIFRGVLFAPKKKQASGVISRGQITTRKSPYTTGHVRAPGASHVEQRKRLDESDFETNRAATSKEAKRRGDAEDVVLTLGNAFM